MSPIRGLWLRLQASLWFVLTLVVAGCMTLAVPLVESHGWAEADLAGRWPRLLRSDDDGPGFLPSLAVTGGVVLALFGVAMLIYFIHHVAPSIQASSILQRIAGDTNDAIDRLLRLDGRRIPSPCRSNGRGLRVIARGPGFEDLAALALDPIAEHARGETMVLGKLLHTLSMLGAGLHDPQQLHALRQRLALLCEAISHGVDIPSRREPLLERARMLRRRLREREVGARAQGPAPEQGT